LELNSKNLIRKKNFTFKKKLVEVIKPRVLEVLQNVLPAQKKKYFVLFFLSWEKVLYHSWQFFSYDQNPEKFSTKEYKNLAISISPSLSTILTFP